MLLKFVFLCLIFIVFCDDDKDKDNFHCLTVNSRPGACYYFVHSSLNAVESQEYCAKRFNGRLATLANTNTLKEFVRNYHWWNKYTKNQTFRLGHRLYNHFDKLNISTCNISITAINFRNMEVDVDETLWKKTFCNITDPKEPKKSCTEAGYERSCKEMKFKESDNFFRGMPKDSRIGFLAVDMDTLKVSVVGSRYTTPFICESPRYPASYCEKGWSLHMKTRSCFRQYNDYETYQGAMKKCRQYQSSLASINDMHEWWFVRKLNEVKREKTVFGIRYTPTSIAMNNFVDRRKTFWKNAFNVDGSPIRDDYTGDINKPVMVIEEYPTWDKNQPETLKGKCIGFLYLWSEYECNAKEYRYICRKMADQIPSEI